MMDLKGQRIVIIGGSSGLGLATAIQAASLGAQIVIASRSPERLLQAKKQVRGSETFCLDVTIEDNVKAFFKKVGSFHHLITPGSASSPGTFIETEVARQSFDSKFWGQYYSAKYGAPNLEKGGSIVFFSGALSQRPIPNTAIMASINSAVEGLARALAIDLAPLRVNAIAPGYVPTHRFETMSENAQKTLYNSFVSHSPLQRTGKPEDIAQAVLYLISNSYVTGTTLYVDGGYVLK